MCVNKINNKRLLRMNTIVGVPLGGGWQLKKTATVLSWTFLSRGEQQLSARVCHWRCCHGDRVNKRTNCQLELMPLAGEVSGAHGKLT